MIELIELIDQDFAWLLAEIPASPDLGILKLPPGGVDSPQILSAIRKMMNRLANADCRASWMVVAEGEVVGLCSFKNPPLKGCAEIGFGIAESRRGKGHASAAIAKMVHLAPLHGAHVLVAETAAANIASQKALVRNAFELTGRRHDEEDGELVIWSRSLRAAVL